MCKQQKLLICPSVNTHSSSNFNFSQYIKVKANILSLRYDKHTHTYTQSHRVPLPRTEVTLASRPGVITFAKVYLVTHLTALYMFLIRPRERLLTIDPVTNPSVQRCLSSSNRNVLSAEENRKRDVDVTSLLSYRCAFCAGLDLLSFAAISTFGSSAVAKWKNCSS